MSASRNGPAQSFHLPEEKRVVQPGEPAPQGTLQTPMLFQSTSDNYLGNYPQLPDYTNVPPFQVEESHKRLVRGPSYYGYPEGGQGNSYEETYGVQQSRNLLPDRRPAGRVKSDDRYFKMTVPMALKDRTNKARHENFLWPPAVDTKEWKQFRSEPKRVVARPRLQSSGEKQRLQRLENQKLVHETLHKAYNEVVLRKIPNIREQQQGEGDSQQYSELSPKCLSSIFQRAGLKNHWQMFLDLGSSVSNAVLQATLETGCFGRGVERRGDRQRFAAPFRSAIVKQCPRKPEKWRKRLAVSGKRAKAAKQKVRSIQGDFFTNRESLEWIQKADVVLCNNKFFGEDVNQRLGDLSQNMKRGARLVLITPLKAQSQDNSPLDDRQTMVYHFRRASEANSWVEGSEDLTYWIYVRA